MDSWSGVGDMPMGAVQTWGMYNCEGTSSDWFRSDYIVVWVGNPVYTRIPDAHFMHEARYRGAKMVVIAPDYNATAIHADLWINVKPETDAALGLAAAQVMIAEGLVDTEYVREQTDLPILVRDDDARFLRESDLRAAVATTLLYFWDEARGALAPVPGCQGEGGRLLALDGLKPALDGRYEVSLADGTVVTVRPVFARLREQLERYTPEAAQSVTGVAPATVRRFAREMAAARTAMIFASWGACKHHHSDLFQRAMILLMALTGNQGKSGGGMRVAAWWGLDGLDKLGAGIDLTAMDYVRIIPKAIRGLTPRDYESLFVKFSEQRATAPLMPFLYVHGGYREHWSKPEFQDPALPRDFDSYVRTAIERGWTQIHPPADRKPRVYIFSGCNPLRRWPASQIAKKHLWPKFDCIVAVNFRMSTSALHADYVLPAAAYYEKYGIKYAQSYTPHIVVSDKATEPLGEAQSEWEIFGRLTERVSQRAAERGVESVRGFNDRPCDLRTAYNRYTNDGRFDPHRADDPVKLMDDILTNSPSIGNIKAEDALKIGAIRITGPARPTPIYANYSDYEYGDTHWPHRWFVEDKIAWPTLTGRQQFYLDHEWYLEAGEALPVHKDPPGARGRLSATHQRRAHALEHSRDLARS